MVEFEVWERWLTRILVLLIIAAPILLTQFSWLFDFSSPETGAIGDTIGGITAPFVNLLAAFLVYKSFTAQIQANRRQRDEHNEQMSIILNEQSINYLMNLYHNIELDYLNNESKHFSTGWGNQLADGLQKLQSLYDTPDWKDKLSKKYRPVVDLLKGGQHDIRQSIPKVRFIVETLMMLSTALSKARSESKDTYLFYTTKYIASKAQIIFHQNNYNYLLLNEINHFAEQEMIDTTMRAQLESIKGLSVIVDYNLNSIINESYSIN